MMAPGRASAGAHAGALALMQALVLLEGPLPLPALPGRG
eukprot:SAG22_NODE_20023_length_269_cov_0.876471_1_plen_38_part_01